MIISNNEQPAIIAEPEPDNAFSELERERAEALLPLAPHRPKKTRLKKYAFDVYGNMHQADKHTPEQWEALKAKLGAIIEIEATSQPEAWKLYDSTKK